MLELASRTVACAQDGSRSRGGVALDMGVQWAWRHGFTGEGVVVSIIDDGIEWTHPDLQQNYVRLLPPAACCSLLIARLAAACRLSFCQRTHSRISSSRDLSLFIQRSLLLVLVLSDSAFFLSASFSYVIVSQKSATRCLFLGQRPPTRNMQSSRRINRISSHHIS